MYYYMLVEVYKADFAFQLFSQRTRGAHTRRLPRCRPNPEVKTHPAQLRLGKQDF